MNLEQLRECFDLGGDSLYGGEAVTQLEHALQAAWLAEQEKASDALVTAALLHDVGHLLHTLPEDAPEHGIDDCHEDLAARALDGLFDLPVIEPVRLHVPAKRYLCATNATYHQELSEPSQLSLKLQGGPMSDAEVAEFETSPYFQDAVRLRHWDDLAKVVGLETPSLDHYWNILEPLALETR
ncbi:MAG: phosphonate degradation HD-domain oxygenase [Aureliella sp.]